MFYPLKNLWQTAAICKKKYQTVFARRLHLNWISENMSEYAPEKNARKYAT